MDLPRFLPKDSIPGWPPQFGGVTITHKADALLRGTDVRALLEQVGTGNYGEDADQQAAWQARQGGERHDLRVRLASGEDVYVRVRRQGSFIVTATEIEDERAAMARMYGT